MTPLCEECREPCEYDHEDADWFCPNCLYGDWDDDDPGVCDPWDDHTVWLIDVEGEG